MVRRSALLALVLPLAFPVAVAAQQPAAKEKAAPVAMSEVLASSLKWGPLEQPGFVPGIQLAVVTGDPSKPAPYTVRLRFPAGYVFPGHWHPNDENLTVLSGTFLLGMGEKTDKTALKKYTAGDYLLLPARMAHFGGVEGETEIQLHGIGPFSITVTEEIPGAAK